MIMSDLPVHTDTMQSTMYLICWVMSGTIRPSCTYGYKSKLLGILYMSGNVWYLPVHISIIAKYWVFYMSGNVWLC